VKKTKPVFNVTETAEGFKTFEPDREGFKTFEPDREGFKTFEPDVAAESFFALLKCFKF
jgi:hypothetical protein